MRDAQDCAGISDAHVHGAALALDDARAAHGVGAGRGVLVHGAAHAVLADVRQLEALPLARARRGGRGLAGAGAGADLAAALGAAGLAGGVGREGARHVAGGLVAGVGVRLIIQHKKMAGA